MSVNNRDGSKRFNNPIIILDTTDAVNSTTGSLVLYGGLSVSSTANLSGIMRISNKTSSTDVSSGALVVGGGVGIENNLNVGGNAYIQGSLTAGSFAVTNLNAGTITVSTLIGSNATLGNLFSTNITTATLIATTGITTSNIYVSSDGGGLNMYGGAKIIKQVSDGMYIIPHNDGNLGDGIGGIKFRNAANNTTSMQVFGDGTLRVTTMVSAANIAANVITTGTLRAGTVGTTLLSATTITAANAHLSGNMFIAGTLTAVNITTTNLMDTNITAGIANITNTLAAIGNSNTVGNIFTTGGNVGIGQGNPSSALSIFNGGMNVGGMNSIITQGAHIQWNRSGGEGESWIINQKGMGAVSSGIRFGTSSTTNNVTEWMRIIENGNVGINNISPTYKLDITGTLRATGGDITTATLLATTSISSGSIQGTNLAANTLRINQVYMTPSSGDIIEELSFTAGNGVTSASNITGLSFSNAIVRGFNALLTSTVVRTTGGNLYANYELKGIQQANGWILNSSFIGDNTGVTFSINTAGNVQYTSTSLDNFTSNTLKFKANTTSIN
jgi:hypothetical protein